MTGAATGLGLAVAQRFLSEGARVAMSDLRQSALDQVAQAMKFVPSAVSAIIRSRQSPLAKWPCHTVQSGRKVC